jgi:hypothetical protein
VWDMNAAKFGYRWLAGDGKIVNLGGSVVRGHYPGYPFLRYLYNL